MKILHLSTDFPDRVAPQKTHAIRNLVDATNDDFEHIVYSLNRIAMSPASAVVAAAQGWPSREVARDRYGPVWIYEAPDKGLFLRSSLESLAENIAEEMSRNNAKPDLILGHKLSMEGIIAARLSQLTGVPYALSIQGNSDRNIINIRRDLRPFYRRIFHSAAVVFPFTPWALEYCESVLGKREGQTRLLPCIAGQEQIIVPSQSNGRLMTAFHLRHRKIKNLSHMLDAAAMISKAGDEIGFDVYGGGEAADIAAVDADIRSRAPNIARLGGPVAHDQMQVLMNSHAGFTMISRKESFGLVFIEALMAGCPVAYPRNAAIDGYFDGLDFAIAVDGNDVGAIAAAMTKQLRDEARLKKLLHDWQNSGGATRFQKAAIAEQFRDGLKIAVNVGKRH